MSDLEPGFVLNDNYPWKFLSLTRKLDGWTGDWYLDVSKMDSHPRNILWNNMVDWVLTNIEDPYTNAYWYKGTVFIYFYFRNPKDYQWFLMRWQ